MVEDVAGAEVFDSLFLDALDAKSLLVFLVKFSGKNLNDEIRELLLGVDVGVEVGFTGFDRGHDGLKRMTTLFHVTLDLPVKLDLRRDVEVKSEVKEITNTFVVHGVETFENDDRGGFNGLGSVERSIDVVVDWLADSLSVLESLNLLVHQIEVVFFRVKGGETGLLTALSVIEMVIVKANDGGQV